MDDRGDSEVPHRHGRDVASDLPYGRLHRPPPWRATGDGVGDPKPPKLRNKQDRGNVLLQRPDAAARTTKVRAQRPDGRHGAKRPPDAAGTSEISGRPARLLS